MSAKFIISGFDGIGKSTAAEKLPGIVIDLESSDFHWLVVDGKKIQHPEWPMNYIKAMRALAFETDDLPNYKDLLYVCISAHAEVLDTLEALGIPYVTAYPAIHAKDEYLQRYRDRGNTEEFIAKLSDQYENFVQSMEARKAPKIVLGAGKDRFLFDILNDPDIPEILEEALSKKDDI